MRLAGREVTFGERTLVMGVINATPDSFSGDGLGHDFESIARQAADFAAAGADLLDIGGESTRPGSWPVGGQREIDRVVPAIAAARGVSDLPISVDTRYARVAHAAIEAGAAMVNDITGLTHDPDLAAVVASAGVPVVLQHIQGTPQTMQANPRYEDVVEEVRQGLAERIAVALEAGIARAQIVVDPGIGFGKSVDHCLRLLRRLSELRTLGAPILVGVSRKSFIGAVLGTEVHDRLEGTAAAVALSIAGGADIVRVHDVAAMVRVARMADAITRGTWQRV